MVNFAYVAFAREVLAQAEAQKTVPARMRRMTRARSFTMLGLFAFAAFVTLRLPLWGFALICCTLFVSATSILPMEFPRLISTMIKSVPGSIPFETRNFQQSELLFSRA